MQIFLWYFGMQTDPPIQTNRSDLVSHNKKKVNQAVPANYRMKVKDKKPDKYLKIIRELKKV